MFDDTINTQTITEAEGRIQKHLSMFDPMSGDGIQIDYSREINLARSEYVAVLFQKMLDSFRGSEHNGQLRKTYRQLTSLWQSKIVKSAPSHVKGWIESGGW